MKIGHWITCAVVAGAALVAGCGDGSGRQGTDVQVTGAAPTAPVAGGQNAVFTMTVTNGGPYTANGVTIVDLVGNLLGLQSITCQSFGGATCPAAPGPSMTLDAMPPGSRLEFTVTATVLGSANGTVTNTMSVNFDDDTDRSNNSITVSGTAFTALGEVVLELTRAPTSATGGGTAEFEYTLRNEGPDVASGVRVVNTVGSNLALTAIACAAAGGATCPTTSPVMDVPSLPVGGTLVFTVTTQVVQQINGTVTNTMAVTADNDTDRTNNSAVGSTSVITPVSGLSLTGSGPTGVAAGTPATFRMTLVNTGPDPAASVRVIDTLGGNLTLTSVACAASGGATCPAALGPLMDVTNMPAGGTLVFDVTATVANGTNGTIINTMSATTTSGPRQEVVAVGTGSAYANNLRVDVIAPTGPVTSGTAPVWTVDVRNDGPASAFNATLTITYGAALSEGSPITCTASGGATCPAALASTMAVPEIPAGGSLSFGVPAQVAAGTDALVSLTMQSSVLGDAFIGDNADTAGVRAVP